MFTILRKNFAGRVFDRYFCDWDKARKVMDEDVDICVEVLDGDITRTIDRMNVDKGFYMYEKSAKFANGETCTWALIDAYFEDNPNIKMTDYVES